MTAPNRDAAEPRAEAIGRAALPVVGLAALEDADGARRAALVAALREACTTHGFFYVVDHGVPEALLRAVLAAARRLFALPDAAKRAIAATHPAGLGYGRMGGRRLDGTAGAPVKEEYYCAREGVPGLADRNRWPDLPGFRRTLEAFGDHMHRLAAGLMALMAESLGLPRDHFAAFCTRPLAALRLVRYPPQGAEAGAHSDFGALTLLLQDRSGGLQVLDGAGGGWIEATPSAGSLLVNLGDLFTIWTGGAYRSTRHRVVHPPGRARLSVPFFYTGAADYRVAPLPGFAGGTGAPPPTTPLDHLRDGHAAQGF